MLNPGVWKLSPDSSITQQLSFDVFRPGVLLLKDGRRHRECLRTCAWRRSHQPNAILEPSSSRLWRLDYDEDLVGYGAGDIFIGA